MAGLELSLLGSVQILLDGEPLTDFVYNKSRALLIYLAVESDRPHSRSELAGLLWPDLSDAAAHTNLRQALSDLRRVLGAESEHGACVPPFLLVTRDTIQFNPRANYTLDVTLFRTQIATCTRHRHRNLAHCPICLAHMEQALSWYRGDYLTGFAVGNSVPLEEWMTLEREALHQQAASACQHVARFYERRKLYDEARSFVQRQLALEPWNEEAHLQLMRLYSMSGQRSAALAQYATCCKILNKELGAAPSAATTDLYQRLGKGETISIESEPDRLRLHDVLPVSPTTLVGREEELTELANLLADPSCRLVTLIGPGGIGKTRLALAAAAREADAFQNGVVFVDLSGATGPGFLAETMLKALDVPLAGPQNPSQQLRLYLRNLEMLVVLDGYDHVLPDIEFLAELLRSAPRVTWLVTSRERLALQVEQLVEVVGLNYPKCDHLDLAAGIETIAAEYAAVHLFLQRARHADRHFIVTATGAAAIVRICQVTEGLPLALELAASAVRVQSCEAISSALERGQLHLAANLRDLPARHLSIYATFEHSWRLLLPQEQRVFCALAVFRGGFDTLAAKAVADATSELLVSLLDKSLICRRRVTDDEVRYSIHELLRQYAAEKLSEAGGLSTAQRHHLEFFTALAEQAEPKLKTNDQTHWLDVLENEHSNLRAALEYALTSSSYEMAARLAGALSRFWFVRAHIHEGLEFLGRISSFLDAEVVRAPSAAAAKAYNGAGWLTFLRGEYVQAYGKFEHGLTLAERTQDPATTAEALRGLALQVMNQGDSFAARRLAQQSLEIARCAGNAWQAGAALNVLGDLARTMGDYQAAAGLFEESQVCLHEAGDRSLLLIVQCNAGWVALALGEVDRAMDLHLQVVRQAHHLGAVRTVAHALDGVASVLVRSQQSDRMQRAVKLMGAAEAVRERSGILLELVDRSDFDFCLSTARSTLEERVFLTMWADGQAMTLNQVVAYVLGEGQFGRGDYG